MRTCTWVALFLASAGCYSSYETSEGRDGAVPLDGGVERDARVEPSELWLRVLDSAARLPIEGADVTLRSGAFSVVVHTDAMGIARTAAPEAATFDLEVVAAGRPVRTSLAVPVAELREGLDYLLEPARYVRIRGRWSGRARPDSYVAVDATAARDVVTVGDTFEIEVPADAPIELWVLEQGERTIGELVIFTSARVDLPPLSTDLEGLEVVLEPARTSRRMLRVPRAPAGHAMHDAHLQARVLGSHSRPTVGVAYPRGRDDRVHELEIVWVDEVERPTLALIATAAETVYAFVDVEELDAFSWLDVPRFPSAVRPGGSVVMERAAPFTVVIFGELVGDRVQSLWTLDTDQSRFSVPELPASLRTARIEEVVIVGAMGDRFAPRLDQLTFAAATP
jgi:hypothetical protein